MYPQQRFDRPGKLPFMDMALVPRDGDVTADGEAGDVSLRVDLAGEQQLGMREVDVHSAPLLNVINATGRIELDPRGIVDLQARAAGIVEHASALAIGDLVSRAQPLFELHIPSWRAAADERLALTQSSDSTLEPIAIQRLQALGVPDEHTSALKRSRRAQSTYAIASPISGVIVSLPTRPGMTVTEGQTLISQNSTRRVVLLVAVAEAMSGAVREGDRVRAHMGADPTGTVTGNVDVILPTLDPATRTARLRVWLHNPRNALRPGATVRVDVESSRTDVALSVPTEAVIRFGRRALVMLAEGAVVTGRWRSRPASIPETTRRSFAARGRDSAWWQAANSCSTPRRVFWDCFRRLSLRGHRFHQSRTRRRGVPHRRVRQHLCARRTLPVRSRLNRRATVHEAIARVAKIAPGCITLAHGPFATLGMPGMTMTFPVADSANARSFSAGEQVRIGDLESAAGLTIVRMVPADRAP